MAIIYLAGGCFWGIEAYLKKIPGVEKTEVGYANGHGNETNYEAVCTGTTGYAETCKVIYDRQKLPLKKLLELFFKVIDPTSINRQGNDRGTQYRTGIYLEDTNDLMLAKDFIKQAQKNYNKVIVTEVEPLHSYYKAESYHQDYLTKNPGGYCHIPLD